MKLSTSITLLPALCWSASATVQIITYPHDDSARSVSLDPMAARAVLAQRLGVEAYHSGGVKSSDAMEAINEFGRRSPLFGGHEFGDGRQGFFLVEEELPISLKGQGLTIKPPPSTTATRGLYLDLLRQADPAAFASLTDDNLAEQMSRIGNHNFGIFQTSKQLSSFLASNPEAHNSATIIYSSESLSDDPVGRWGTYEMPGAQSLLRKRSQPIEAPLELDTIAPLRQSANPAISVLANSSKAVVGILPACFASQSLCVSVTRNCSGHGLCKHKYTDKTANSKSSASECYSCECSVQRTKNEKGQTVTTQWGGPACQKKDVSTQFWLLALFTVGLVFVVMFAIGQIMAMGGQELPSVIGAGVSGPIKRT